MSVYRVALVLYVDGADNSDQWAEGICQSVLDNAKVLAVNATTFQGASAAEAQSHGIMGVSNPDGTVAIEDVWHVSLGQVVDGLPGEPVEVDPDEWSGNSVVYAVDDLVTFEGNTYRCITGHTSQAGWTPVAVPSLWQAI